MDILDLERTVKPDWWLKQIASCDWSAGQYLHTLLTENRFHAQCGETARVLREFSNGEDDLTQYIVSTIGRIDPLWTPRSVGDEAAWMYFSGTTEEDK